jgi:type III secretion protein T
MPGAPLDQLLQALEPWLLGTILAMARPMAIVIIVPAFTRLAMTQLLRSAVVFALALPLLPHLVLASGAVTASASPLPLLIVKEALIGGALGLAIGLPFWAAQAAGDFVDNQRAASAGTLFDPSSGAPATVTGTFFTVVLVAIFYSGGGLRSLLEVLYGSYRVWPAEVLLPQWQGDAGALGDALLAILDGIVSLGLLLAGPVILLLLAIDFVLGMVGRFAPQLNVFDLSLSAKSAAFLVALLIYWGFLAQDLEDLLDWRSLLRTPLGVPLP